MPSKIPTIFKISGVSFCKTTVDTLEKNQELKLEKDPENKYDKMAIKVLTLDNKMCGFVPRKFKCSDNSEINLNEEIHKKWEKLTNKYILKVCEIYKWNGPSIRSAF